MTARILAAVMAWPHWRTVASHAVILAILGGIIADSVARAMGAM